MGASSATRPPASPAPVIETVTPGHDPTTVLPEPIAIALRSVQRSLAQLAAPVATLAAHPTTRDALQTVTLQNGTNWIPNAIGRAPRHIYVAPLGPGLTSWWWKQQGDDLDRQRLDIEVSSGGPVKAIVRME
ncbi:MAG TPA: hypothetical protein VKR80_07420 [Candidatus Limnocylindria bacterium]|nr:hypothetical protein [Candidatus Limnocylindria bacterium]